MSAARNAARCSRARVAYETLRAVHESDAYANLLLPKAIARAGLRRRTRGWRPSSRMAHCAGRAPTTRSSPRRPPATSTTSIRPCSMRCASRCTSCCTRASPPTPRSTNRSASPARRSGTPRRASPTRCCAASPARRRGSGWRASTRRLDPTTSASACTPRTRSGSSAPSAAPLRPRDVPTSSMPCSRPTTSRRASRWPRFPASARRRRRRVARHTPRSASASAAATPIRWCGPRTGASACRTRARSSRPSR